MNNKTVTKIIVAILTAAAITAVCGLGWLDSADGVLSDRLYNQTESVDGEVVIIGMDQTAVDAFGPMPWSREIIADVIAFLNSEEENKPAAIGVDVLYVGESSDPEADDFLVWAAEDGGNVVFASAATFGSELVTDGTDFYMDTRAILAWDSPFEALAEVSDTGHINAMADDDAIIRHALYTLDVPGVGQVKPFARVLYEKYCEYWGETPNSEPETTDGFFYLPYTARHGAYESGYSVADVYYGQAEPADFAGKIVLIGPYTMGMQDEYRGSIDHVEAMYGIEIQANQIDAYRRGYYPSEVPQIYQLGALFVISALVCFVFLDNSVKKLLVIWLGGCAAWIGLCFLGRMSGNIIHVLWVPLAITVIFIGCVAVNYIRARAEKKKVEKTFGRYIDPAIMKELLEEGTYAETLGGKSFDIACLFVDIRGFTTMSESLEPATVVEIINKYLTLTTECIMRHHGTLDKFVGDCTMAFWNAPVAQEDPVYLACCAAMDMVEGSKQLALELEERFGRSVSFGVGVHYGPAVVGNIGAPQRMDFTAIGDTVNTASRLESNAPKGTVYISRIVADMLGERAKTTSLGGTIKLKGKTEGFEVLTLDSLDMTGGNTNA